MDDLPRRGASPPIGYRFPPEQYNFASLLSCSEKERSDTDTCRVPYALYLPRYLTVVDIIFCFFFLPPHRADFFFFVIGLQAFVSPCVEEHLPIVTGRFSPIVAAGWACVMCDTYRARVRRLMRTGNEFDTRALDDMMDFHFPGVGKGRLFLFLASRVFGGGPRSFATNNISSFDLSHVTLRIFLGR